MNVKKLNISKGVSIEVLSDGKTFCGIGEILISGISVRDGRWPICPRIETPDGLYFNRFELGKVETKNGRTILNTVAYASALPLQYCPDWYRPQVPTKLITANVSAEVSWIIEAVEYDVCGEKFIGLSYAFHYRGKAKIHRITDWGTFELGGNADGILLVSRSCTRPPEHKITAKSRYTSAEEYGPDRQKPTGVFRQLAPRFGAHQCFDFQWRPEATLLLAHDRPAYINGLTHKEAGDPWIQIVNEHWFPLSGNVKVPAHLVLVRKHAIQEDLYQGRTRWMRCWRWARTHYGSQIGMPMTRPFIMCQIEESPAPGKPETGIRILNRLKNKILPAAAKLGFNAVYFGPFWECNASRRQALSGIASGISSSVSVCAPFEYKFADAWGGDKLIKEVAGKGRKLGVNAMPWLATHLANRTPDSPLYKENPGWRIINPSGSPYDGNYGDLCSGSLNTGYWDYWFGRLRHHTEKLGIGSWFFDSYSNLTIPPVNFADPLLRPQIEKVWEAQAYCLKHGVIWAIEADGPFGHASMSMAMKSSASGAAASLEDYKGEKAYTLLDANLRFGYDRAKHGDFPADTFFRSLAACGPLCVAQSPKNKSILEWVSPEIQKWIRIFRQNVDLMAIPALLPDDSGILWEDPSSNKKFLWSFRKSKITLPKKSRIFNHVSGLCEGESETVRTEKYSVFEIGEVNDQP